MKESLRILIVEDELITATDLRETLEKAGHTVTAIARSFSEALKSARQQTPDVALLDIRWQALRSTASARPSNYGNSTPCP